MESQDAERNGQENQQKMEKRGGPKKKCQSEVQKMREGQRGKEILKRSVKDGKVGGGERNNTPREASKMEN
jgi:hypothetical protein